MRLSEPIPGEDYIAGGMASVLRNRLLLTYQWFSFSLSDLCYNMLGGYIGWGGE